ncbi:MAG TPA: hypothetical protein VHO47_05220 [Candidatus Babeliales bacterium]|nr:hypothetical protein [Candidatus Babeliales bacterium]
MKRTLLAIIFLCFVRNSFAVDKKDIITALGQIKNAITRGAFDTNKMDIIRGAVESLRNYGINSDADLEKYVMPADFNILHEALKMIVLKDYANQREFDNAKSIMSSLVALGSKIEQINANKQTLLHQLVQKDEPVALEMVIAVAKIAQRDLPKEEFDRFINAIDYQGKTALDYVTECRTNANKIMDKDLCNAMSKELKKMGAQLGSHVVSDDMAGGLRGLVGKLTGLRTALLGR